MKILTLGSSGKLLHPYLSSHDVRHTEDPIGLQELRVMNPEVILSFGYRHIVTKELLDAFQGKFVNLHISMLPWNRGADPNFWSWFEDTPKGVTIHLMDAGLDTGDILLQAPVNLQSKMTLSSSYLLLQDEIVDLFAKNVEEIISLQIVPVRQEQNSGSIHRSKDKTEIFQSLQSGWDTPCFIVEQMGRDSRSSAG